MVIYKLEKTGNAIFYSHHDMMRIFLLSLSRAGINTKKSRSGAMEVYFSTATNIGVESVAEFVEINTDMQAHKLADILKTYLPDGIKIIAEYDTKERLNISKIACLAKYEIEANFTDFSQSQITKVLKSPDFTVSTKINNEVSSVKAVDAIHNFYFDKGKLYIIAGVGENSLNVLQTIMQVLHKIKVDAGKINVKKLNLFASFDGRFHDIELLILRLVK